MRASTRSTPRGPVRLRRGARRGSAVGLGLLVATSAMAPAALAEEGTATGDDAAPETGQDVDTGLEPAPLNPLPPEEGAGDVPPPDVPEADDLSVPGDADGDGVADAEIPAVITAELADFGSGKDFTISVEPGDPAPDDLDLSGATFALTEVGDEGPAGECVTDQDGWCSVVVDEEVEEAADGTLFLPAGSYVITQTAAPTGLEAAPGPVGVLELCPFPQCSFAPEPVAVANASLFRTEVVTRAADATDGTLLSGASYGLTGPDYPRADPDEEGPDPELPFPGFPFPGFPFPGFPFPGLPVGAAQPPAAPAVAAVEPAVVPEAASTFDAGTETTGADGTATHEGWFLPEEGYMLTPLSAPAGYVLDGDVEFAIDTTAAEAGTPWTMEHSLSPDYAGPDSGNGSGGGPRPGPRPRPAPAPAPVPAPAPAPVAAPAPGPVDQGAPDGSPAAAADPAPTSTPSPSASPSSPSTPGIPAEQTLSVGTDAVDSPELETVASDLPDAGLVAAFGIGFLAVVLTGLALVRRHARRGR